MHLRNATSLFLGFVLSTLVLAACTETVIKSAPAEDAGLVDPEGTRDPEADPQPDDDDGTKADAAKPDAAKPDASIPFNGKKCMKSPDGTACYCRADPNYAPTTAGGVPFVQVASCDPGVTGKSYCCSGSKNNIERCTCDSLVCKASSGGSCSCGPVNEVASTGSSGTTTACPAPSAGIHCCNRLGEANCDCGTQACGAGYVEVANCNVDVMVKDCDGVDEPATTCIFPSEK